MKLNGLNGYLNDPEKRLTVFAPTEAAYELMRAGSLGRKLLDADNSGNLINVSSAWAYFTNPGLF